MKVCVKVLTNNLNKQKNEKSAKDELFMSFCDQPRKTLLKLINQKYNTTENLLGFRYSEITLYSELSKLPDLQWQNFCLNHVRPLSPFDLSKTEEIKEAAFFTSFQRLFEWHI